MNDHRTHVPIRLLILGSLLALAGAAGAQEPPPEPDPRATFREVLDVRVFNVEVTVRGPGGRPATGLGKEDFRLLVDGEPAEIEYFTEIREGRIAASEAPPPALAATEPEERIGTHYLVFVDELSMPVKQRSEALRRMGKEVEERWAPEDRMAVVAMSGHQFRMLSPWTDAAGELARLFKDAARKTGSLTGEKVVELTAYQKFGGVGARVSGGGRGALPSEAIVEVGGQALREAQDDLARVVDAAVDALYAFAETPGRKVLLLLSGGWPASLEDRTLELGKPNPLWKLVDASNALGYTLFPVHVKQLTPSRQMPAAAGTRHFSRDNFFAQESLAGPAEETGGRLLSMGNTYFERVASYVEAYYWLGFTSSKPDGERHSIEVQTLRPDLEVRARGSFVHSPPEVERARRTAAELRAGAGRYDLAVTAAEPRPAGRGRLEVPLSLEIPLGAFVFLSEGSKHVARLELRIASLDARGRRSPIPEIPVELAFDAPPAPGGRAVYDITVALRRAEQTLEVTLADLQGEGRLSGRLEIEP